MLFCQELVEISKMNTHYVRIELSIIDAKPYKRLRVKSKTQQHVNLLPLLLSAYLGLSEFCHICFRKAENAEAFTLAIQTKCFRQGKQKRILLSCSINNLLC